MQVDGGYMNGYSCLVFTTEDQTECDRMAEWCREVIGKSHGPGSQWWQSKSAPLAAVCAYRIAITSSRHFLMARLMWA